mmetsp:Transcript_29451/g.62561  ORF Transcript_29451/g.62561 Transcript_29451/m.62561 type:complete len:82 (+) Transcript_29451:806-1051(+)
MMAKENRPVGGGAGVDVLLNDKGAMASDRCEQSWGRIARSTKRRRTSAGREKPLAVGRRGSGPLRVTAAAASAVRRINWRR